MIVGTRILKESDVESVFQSLSKFAGIQRYIGLYRFSMDSEIARNQSFRLDKSGRTEVHSAFQSLLLLKQEHKPENDLIVLIKS